VLRYELTKKVVNSIGDDVPIVSNLGPTSRELRGAKHRERNLYQYGSVDTKVISLDGDGAVVMNMGTLATIGRHKPKNLIVIVYDNEEWGQTAHMPSHTSAGTDLEKVAASCGIPKTATVRTIEDFDLTFNRALKEDGPWCIVAKVDKGGGPKTPSVYEPEFNFLIFHNSYSLK
jgi:sulfopyruvate decarboxylase subunit beta